MTDWGQVPTPRLKQVGSELTLSPRAMPERSKNTQKEKAMIRNQEKWKVVSGAGRLKMKVCKDSVTVPCSNSFRVLQDKGDMQVLKDRKGKADEVFPT